MCDRTSVAVSLDVVRWQAHVSLLIYRVVDALILWGKRCLANTRDQKSTRLKLLTGTGATDRAVEYRLGNLKIAFSDMEPPLIDEDFDESNERAEQSRVQQPTRSIPRSPRVLGDAQKSEKVSVGRLVALRPFAYLGPSMADSATKHVSLQPGRLVL